MRAGNGKDLSSSGQSPSDLPDIYAPRLLIETEPAHRVFFGNLIESIVSRRVLPSAQFAGRSAFWSDVFVSSGLPWSRFVESFAIHLLAIAILWGAARAGWLRPQVLPGRVFSKRDVIISLRQNICHRSTLAVEERTSRKEGTLNSVSRPSSRCHRKQTIALRRWSHHLTS